MIDEDRVNWQLDKGGSHPKKKEGKLQLLYSDELLVEVELNQISSIFLTRPTD